MCPETKKIRRIENVCVWAGGGGRRFVKKRRKQRIGRGGGGGDEKKGERELVECCFTSTETVGLLRTGITWRGRGRG